MLRKNLLEEVERVFMPGYRKPFDHETDRLSMAAILHYRVVE